MASSGYLDSLLMPPPPKRPSRIFPGVQTSETASNCNAGNGTKPTDTQVNLHTMGSKFSTTSAIPSGKEQREYRTNSPSAGDTRDENRLDENKSLPHDEEGKGSPEDFRQSGSSDEDFEDQSSYCAEAYPEQDLRSKPSSAEQSAVADGRKRRKLERHKPPINLRFSDIIGHGEAKLRLDEALLPLALPAGLSESILTGVRAAPASVLLHGPPGCGKTQLARAVAGEAQAAFMGVSPSDVLSKFVGESEASIRGLFKEAHSKACKMESQCCVLFFDEIDALGQSRGEEGGCSTSNNGNDSSSRRILAELLIQMTKNFNDDTVDSSSESDSDDGSDDESGVTNRGSLNDEHHDGAAIGATKPKGDNYLEASRSTNTTADDANGVGSGCTRHLSRDRARSPHPISPVPPSIEQSHSHSSETSRPSSSSSTSAQCASPARTNSPCYEERQQKPRVLVIAATNRPEDCDSALLRRFAVRVHVGLPSRRDRRKIVAKLLSDIEHSITTTQLDEVAAATDGWSGSDLESLTREAAMAPIRECLRTAAVYRARARRKQQHSGAESAQENHQRSTSTGDDETVVRENLLKGFRHLRSVTLDDFGRAMTFLLGNDQAQHPSSGTLGHEQIQIHYDSASSSDEESS